MLSRRALLVGAAAASVRCSRSEPVARSTATGASAPQEAPPQPPPLLQPIGTLSSASVRLLEWQINPPGGMSTRVVAIVPSWGTPDARYPVVVALHGRGEAVKPPALGAMGWARDYAMTRAFDRLRAPPLAAEDFEGFVDPDRLARLNASLQTRPFGGLVVACPHVPDFDWSNGGEVRNVGRFVTDVLLPIVRRETPALAAPESTGIDGVSMGGALALRIGLASPDVFGAVGSLQAAIHEDDAEPLAEMARAARARRSGIALRLLTSHDDYFHDAIARTHEVWNELGIAHDYADVPGPHDYVFNRGPGSIELLTWHDKVLARG
jgi:enterochelin esterase-like enzyme